jgi:apolipoprotein N-acyltransferase
LGTTLVFYIGSLGLSYLTLFIFESPYIFLLENKKNRRFLYLTYIAIFITIVFFIFLRAFQEEENVSNSLSVTIAQLNYPINQHLSLEEKKSKVKKITELINNSKTEIIIFSENEFPFLMNEESINFFQKNINKNQIIIIGSTRKESHKFYNSFFLITKNAYQKFDKKILVPFGEFIPFRRFLSFMEHIAGNEDFTKGSDDRYIKIQEDFSILPVICYEITYPFHLMSKDTNILINITNDSWFGNFLGPYQHFYFTKLRAAEFKKPIIRVSSNGISAFIDKSGNIKEFIKLNVSGIKHIIVDKEDISNNFLQFHKIFFYLIVSFLFFGLLMNIRK